IKAGASAATCWGSPLLARADRQAFLALADKGRPRLDHCRTPTPFTDHQADCFAGATRPEAAPACLTFLAEKQAPGDGLVGRVVLHVFGVQVGDFRLRHELDEA